MKKVISMLLTITIILSLAITLTACSDSDEKCYICGGTGYYQKKDCPGC